MVFRGIANRLRAMAIEAVFDRLCGGTIFTSKKLILAYTIDWVLIIGTGLVGYAFTRIEPNRSPFSLTDLSISYPYKVHETVSTTVMVLVSLLAPAMIILLLTLVFVPGPLVDKNAPSFVILKRKLWELNAGWMGLGVSLAGVYMCTEALKDLYGKPRPDLLDRCRPDLSNIAAYAVSGLGLQLEHAPVLVTWEICQNKSYMLRKAGFASFPSGHSSCMTYLTLWLCSKFSITIPYLSQQPLDNGIPPTGPQDDSNANDTTHHHRHHHLLHIFHETVTGKPLPSQFSLSIRNRGAPPPVYLLIVALIPLGVAAFISSSRWFDHRHYGFDILFGSIMGILFAFLGFYLYHLPIRRGAGWSWGPRSPEHAFWKGIGYPNQIAADGWTSSTAMEAKDEGLLQNEHFRHERWSRVISSTPDVNGSSSSSSNEV
ncbi:hypothetical protein DTO021D3_3957 [Paecilomyces variotii]|nr:hypothetical protein DTO032I3_2890 [Paecilomyces variotii]KAJ9279198.1 hypothetical protein DTO021D3_3957 [Paecilomyces variotii]KAJ9341446.1 hypothetical protein DTO027B6_5977 [Paecilomyces variotii]KAJ9385238.1 hypothetical protein DTO032I4_4198 [Paecilomyces variotii]KAJ9404774.1 hypothetical protein DTO045G8_7457 [Paecilomyces variotii]